MTVFVVFFDEGYERDSFSGVYSTKELAQIQVEKIKKQNYKAWHEEVTLDEGCL